MNKKILFASITVVVILVGLSVLGKSKITDEQALSSSEISSVNLSPTLVITPVPADKVEVVHFHGTQQCWSCITVGQYALKTIKERFPDEYSSGRVIFRDINGELKENQEIVTKYQARGSSLFINAIRDNVDDIVEDTNVWRLVGNENQFISYFEAKLKALLK